MNIPHSSFHIQLINRDGFRYHHERDITYLYPMTLLQVGHRFHNMWNSFMGEILKTYQITPEDITEGLKAFDRFIGECSKPDNFIKSDQGFQNAWVNAGLDKVHPAVITAILFQIGVGLTSQYYFHCRSVIPLGDPVIGSNQMSEILDRNIYQLKQELPHKEQKHQEEKEEFINKATEEGFSPPRFPKT